MPICWSRGEQRLLHGTSAEARLRGLLDSDEELPSRTRTAWREVVAPLARRAPKLRLPRHGAGQRAHAHATALVSAYSFTLGDGKHQGMVPFWDALNHTHPEAASVRLRHDPRAGRLEMIIVRAVARGEQVYNTCVMCPQRCW